MATPAQVEPAFCIPALNGFRSRLAQLFMELGVKGAPTIPLPSTVLLAAQRLNPRLLRANGALGPIRCGGHSHHRTAG
jgi:hypothetical protein